MEQYASATPEFEDSGWVALPLSTPMPDRVWRALVQVSLHWDQYSDLVVHNPIIRRRLELLTGRYGHEVDVAHIKAALVASACLQIGWLAASNWFLAATDATSAERELVTSLLVDIDRSILDVAIQRFAAG